MASAQVSKFTACEDQATGVSETSDSRPLTVTLSQDDWRFLAECAEFAQMGMLETLQTAPQAVGPGLVALIQRDASRACDMKERLRKVAQG